MLAERSSRKAPLAPEQIASFSCLRCVSDEHAVILFRQEVCAQSRGAELFIARLILTQRRENTLILSDVYCMMPQQHQNSWLYNMNA
jgi:hypothetical protein